SARHKLLEPFLELVGGSHLAHAEDTLRLCARPKLNAGPTLTRQIARRDKNGLGRGLPRKHTGGNKDQIRSRRLDPGQIHEVVVLAESSNFAEILFAGSGHHYDSVPDLFHQLLPALAVDGLRLPREEPVG